MANPVAMPVSVRATFAAVVSTIVPAADRLGREQWGELQGLIDGFLRNRPAALRRQLSLLLRAIEWLPLVRYGRPFTSLGSAERTRVLSHLQNHRIQLVRVAFWGIRTLALLGYYGRPDAARSVGYFADRRGWEAVA